MCVTCVHLETYAITFYRRKKDTAALMTQSSYSKKKSDRTPKVTPIFIIGSPRTGSTVLYQLVVGTFGLPYISNFTNEYFAKIPLTGLFIQKFFSPNISLESSYGKTRGRFSPSEGSNLMKHWFGGDQPSQIKSNKILPGREKSLHRTLKISEMIYRGKSLVIKNAWNCFRIPYLAETFPSAKFIWIRRDIYHAALSDLKARQITKGSLSEWNSATPANVEELQTLPPHEQVIENQYEFNHAICDALLDLEGDRTLEIWYEDLIDDGRKQMNRISSFLHLEKNEEPKALTASDTNGTQLSETTLNEMQSFIDQHQRFDLYRYKKETT